MNRFPAIVAILLVAACAAPAKDIRSTAPALTASLPSPPIAAARCIQGRFERKGSSQYPPLRTRTLDTPPNTEIGVIVADKIGAVADLEPAAGGSSVAFRVGNLHPSPSTLVERFKESVVECGGQIGP